MSVYCFFFIKQNTAYERRISDWSSDVCSSDLQKLRPGLRRRVEAGLLQHLLVVEQLFGIQDPRQAVAAALIFHGRPGPGKDALPIGLRDLVSDEIGRASCRESVCQYV